MDAIAEAIRQELLRLLADPLTGPAAARVARVAGQAAKLLAPDTCAAVAAVLSDPSAQADPADAADTMETGGVRAIRELIAGAPALIARYENAPDRLTAAIRDARAHGMTDVSRELERRLTGGEVLDSERFVPPPVPSFGAFAGLGPPLGVGAALPDPESEE